MPGFALMSMTILRPGRNVWRIERAARAAVLIDGAAFFSAVREAFLKARRSILIVGWDIDSRTRLIGESGRAGDGYSSEFAEFLAELVNERPGLHVHLLLWDYSLLYAGERELLPRLSLQWRAPGRIMLLLDDTVPFGCSQHQKIVVVDDAVAFSGGLDLTIRRWDTSTHDVANAHRVDPSGHPYRPFHDVQMMVDGDAAQALALLARQRWCRAGGQPQPVEPAGDLWPTTVTADFSDVEIAIARTQPRYDGQDGAREVEALLLDSIDQAQRSMYIENQFVTSARIARRLARRLRRCPQLEIVIVAPRSYDSFVERYTMRNGRIRFWRIVHRAGGKRVRLLYPSVEQEGQVTDTMIHSKVMVVDDWFLRIGSANFNNRSMGADTECDLAVEAENDGDRAAVLAVRDRLLAEHCGVTADDVTSAVTRTGSLVEAVDELAGRGHRLRPIDDGEPDRGALAALAERIADPSRPPQFGRLVRRVLSRALAADGAAAAIIALCLIALGFTLAWHFSDLSNLVSLERLRDLFAGARTSPWAVVLVVAIFLLGAAVAFPVNLLILATSVAFGPWLGGLYAALGSLASALALYFVGVRFGAAELDRRLGPRWKRALDGVRKRGVLAVVALRLVPVAPFTLVNLAAGASGIRLGDFVLGSIVGMAPGFVLISVMGYGIVGLFTNPSAGEIGLLALCIVAWLALAAVAQRFLSRHGGRSS